MRRYFTILTIIFVLATLLRAPQTSGSGQEQEQKSKTVGTASTAGNSEQRNETLIRIDTELVQIDVVVEDEKGLLVRDLKRDDFQLIEDGKPQKIAYFSAGTASRPARWPGSPAARKGAVENPSSATEDAVETGRYIVLAVDDLQDTDKSDTTLSTSLRLGYDTPPN